MKKRIAIVGAGGCAREVAWTVRALEEYEVAGYVVTDLTRLGEHDSRDEVLGDSGSLENHRIDALVMGIGNPTVRRSVATEFVRNHPALKWPSIVHPSLHAERDSLRVGQGSVVCAGVVATVNITLGNFCMVHYGSTIGHESTIGAFSVVNPGANISGGVTIGEASMIGAGAVIRQYLRVGNGARVGAGAVVVCDVPDGETWAGVPAKRMKV